MRWVDENGIVRFATMRIDNAFVELMAATEGYQTPKRLGVVCQTVVVLVDDVDTHYQNARGSGATIIAEPEDKSWGLRQYTAEDLEGHHWEFSQYLRDVPPAEWGAQLMEQADVKPLPSFLMIAEALATLKPKLYSPGSLPPLLLAW